LVDAGRAIEMGYGLHFGWAIEGVIGSSMKIDASYLSPHVNTAARLEVSAGAIASHPNPLSIFWGVFRPPRSSLGCRF
jgi:class 3 adenylate cyclase